ncbi:nucleoside-triphosphatase [uncultured Vagococcus sp.]|uniref:nucleoside-triphosphatase n=1 Tax=uncultured Vagococcus sp. TaxID=189676 RepID=UPI0028D0FD5D|nr:nucleoside-triphosphatase [uncultured Vagococcus sp.]
MGLFLEGPKRIGKSTLLRQQLIAGNYQVGGFYVQRLLSSCHEVTGFQLCSAESILIETSSYKWSGEACFLRQIDGQMVPDLEVFENFGRQLLEQALNQSYEVILLDEIGGLELQVASFYQPLLTLLKSSKKIVGVYKSTDNYRQLAIHQQLQVEKQRVELEELMGGSRIVIDQLGTAGKQVADYLAEPLSDIFF